MAVRALYVQSVPKSAKTPEAILKQLHLTAEDIATAAQDMFDRSE